MYSLKVGYLGSWTLLLLFFLGWCAHRWYCLSIFYILPYCNILCIATPASFFVHCKCIHNSAAVFTCYSLLCAQNRCWQSKCYNDRETLTVSALQIYFVWNRFFFLMDEYFRLLKFWWITNRNQNCLPTNNLQNIFSFFCAEESHTGLQRHDDFCEKRT